MVRSIFLAFCLGAACAFGSGGHSIPLRIGEHDYSQVLETPHPYPGCRSGNPELVWSDYYSHPSAAYVVFEFKQFDLEPGDWVEVKDPRGEKVHRYEGKGSLGQGDEFISYMVPGSEAIVELYSVNTKPSRYGYRIERVTRGFSDEEMEAFYTPPGSKSICGTDDQKDAICYQTSYPDVYNRAKAVARVVMDGSALCTAWLVSCQNHVLTSNRCTWDDNDFDTQGELDRMEFQFMYQETTCGGSEGTWEYSFMGGSWLENDHDLDYTLIQPPAGQNPQATYGHLQIDDRLAAIDETIYIVGHPSGRPKEISLESTDASDAGGFCQVYSTNEPVCGSGTVPEIGYMCDTEGGNPGSPVLSRNTNKVIALHHCDGCPNRGVRIQNVYADIQASAHPLPPCAIYSYAGSVKLDHAQYGCTETLAITVTDDSVPPKGTGSAPVIVWSTEEPTPEGVVLSETPADSGIFIGTFPLSPDPAVHGDGQLSVANGDTLTVRYMDADDGQGGINIPREDSAAVGCAPDLHHQAHLAVDDCSAGGTGDADGVLDAGEIASIQVTAANAGTLTATGVTATLSTTTPGITITDASASFPDLPVGGAGMSLAPHFSFSVDGSVVCGTVIDFNLAFTAAQGTWNDIFSVTIGVPPTGSGTAFSDDFENAETWGNWIVTTGPGPHTCGPFARVNTPAQRPAGGSGYYALSNSDACGSGTTTSSILTSPVIDTSNPAWTAVTLECDLFYNYYNGGDEAMVQVYDGSGWVTVWTDTNADVNAHHAWDVSALALGNADFRVRFSYQNAAYDYWLAADNVVVNFTAPSECAMTVCPASGPNVQFDGTYDPNASLMQVCGDNDLVVEPGEDWRITVRLKNVGINNATNTVASLAVNAGSAVAATIQSGNPGAYGTITSGGGTATADFVFRVAQGAICGNNLTFDMAGISSAEKSYPDQSPAFIVPMGIVSGGGNETKTQQTTPLNATSNTVNSNLGATGFTLAAADTATLNYSSNYATQTSTFTLFSDEFTADPAANGWTEAGNVTNPVASPTDTCPGGGANYAFILGAGAAPGNSIRRVVDSTGRTNIKLILDYRFQYMDSGEGIFVDYSTSGVNGVYANIWSKTSTGVDQNTAWGDDCARTITFPVACENNANFAVRIRDSAGNAAESVWIDHLRITGDAASGGIWTANARVSLVDPSNMVTVLKAYGSIEGSPYNVQPFYTGPGTYQIRLEENAGGTATITNGSMNVVKNPTSECDLALCGSVAPPPVKDTGAGAAKFAKGAGDTLAVTYDAATCSAQKVIILYNSIGAWAGYAGCAQSDGGNGGSTTINSAGQTSTWYNLVWTDGTTAGHPGFPTTGARNWNAAGFCGMTGDNHTHTACP